MPHTTTSPFRRSNSRVIAPIDQASSRATYHTNHGLLRAALRDAPLDVVGSAHDLHGIDRVEFGACARLHALLIAHPVDDRGRCSSCHPGWLAHRRQVCMIYQKAHYWLRQPTHLLQAHLAGELGVNLPPLPDAADPEATAVLPVVADDPPIVPSPGPGRSLLLTGA
ncbi:MAG TPA: hypothetical protein VJT72_20770 [Pseudonocardiaceae bacterium]|nr:hypothetical protein [Pseudonocardiaceae bacterium]